MSQPEDRLGSVPAQAEITSWATLHEDNGFHVWWHAKAEFDGHRVREAGWHDNEEAAIASVQSQIVAIRQAGRGAKTTKIAFAEPSS